MNLIDTHAHLEEVNNLKDAIKRAAEIGVIAIIAVGSDYDSNVWVMNESRKYEVKGLKIYSALGLHPWGLDPSKVEETIEFIEKNVDKAVALGEVGLDYWDKEARRSEDRRELQRRIFKRILYMAKINDKPVSIHSRGAWEDCVNIVIEAGVKRAVFHWFSGPNSALKRLIDHGYYVSATPAAAYSKEHRRVILKTPLENIILETDSPVAYAGEPSEPAHIIKALNAVAEIKGLDVKTVAEETTENAKRIFRFN
ncbi:MAG: TatD family hydrolase [Candidatus Bathyarchaeota archaeon]|nr:TatD family hydrolase [Candidatus Bathyarchaeota archaeon]